jgi:nitrite reductase/ring-hydroxylating ferredoxin subunit
MVGDCGVLQERLAWARAFFYTEQRSNIDNIAVQGTSTFSPSAGQPEVNEESMPQRIDLCSAADISPGNALKVETGDLVLAVFNVDGEYFAMDDLCTHGPGSLSEGYIEGDVVECNFHNGQFNIKTGEVVAPPCMVPAKIYKTMVENGRVVIETE